MAGCRLFETEEIKVECPGGYEKQAMVKRVTIAVAL